MGIFGYGINSYLRLIQQLINVFCLLSFISMLSIGKVLLDERSTQDDIMKKIYLGDVP